MIDVSEIARFIHTHRDQDHDKIREQLGSLGRSEVAEILNAVKSLGEVAEVLTLLPPERAIEICGEPTLARRFAIIEQVPPELGARIVAGLTPDVRTTVLQRMSKHAIRLILPMLSGECRRAVKRMLRFRKRTAGDLMTPEFVELAPTMTVSEALAHIRDVAQYRETIYACYVLDPESRRLLGAVSLRDLTMADGAQQVSEIMRPHPVTVEVGESQKEVALKISKYNLLAVPVLGANQRVVGFVTVDDIIDIMVEEQTNTVLRMGAVEPGALDDPYMKTSWQTLVLRRANWLVLLFLGEMLTATAMGHFEDQIAKAVVLALFVPLIISSGGNSGSQATSLIIRALALGEVVLRDWYRVLRRELVSGLSLGLILGAIGVIRICLWEWLGWQEYGVHWFLIASTVGLSLVGIVLWGSVSGAMLPFILKRIGLDPATSSAPFVATLVDVTGLIIYFSVARVILSGTLL
jgi:magnesium transporter